MRCKIKNPMTTEQQPRQRLRKIAALFEGATTVGERNAAAAAIDRVKRAIDATSKVDTPVEYHFNFPDHWKRRLFSALGGLVQACRYCGLLDESVRAHHCARRLDPKIVTSVAHTFFLLGDYERTLEWY